VIKYTHENNTLMRISGSCD